MKNKLLYKTWKLVRNSMIAFLVCPAITAQVLSFDNPNVLNLSGRGWKAWLDRNAEWGNDTLYLPSEIVGKLSDLPVNKPTGGWEILENEGKSVSVPMTMDEYMLGGINTKTYHGVSWAWRSFEVPANMKGKRLILHIDRARLRAEVYINRKLAAYDIIGETPFESEVTSFINYGAANTIAIRLTNPGGRRGWYDSNVRWGNYTFQSNGSDFSALGDVEITSHDKVYIEDIFVKNILPAGGRKVEITLTVNNTTGQAADASLALVITGLTTSVKLASERLDTRINPGKSSIPVELTVAKATPWSPENPALYNCHAEVKTKDSRDAYVQTFGFRVFQVMPGSSGEHNYYLNGKRFFLKTAIDWGFYAPSGYFATPEAAIRSVEAARALGQNGISFHRKIGEPLVMKYADEKGICIYEEPGGFHFAKTDKGQDDPYVAFSISHILEKIRRMVIRDRNHPSLLMYCLSNEDLTWDSTREAALKMINMLDNSRLVTNSSGIPPDPTHHFRPYESEIRTDLRDQHTADNRGPRYLDDDFYQKEHRTEGFKDCIYYLGEVNSVTGPSNWFSVYESILPHKDQQPGYDLNIYKENHEKISDAFTDWRLGSSGSGNIKSPVDVSLQAGRGMMYIHARHAQSVMCNNTADGYALNGWTTGPQSEADWLDWDSGILDEGRFLKGPAGSFSYWTRPLQISLSRKNGKYFNVNDSAKFEINLINQGKLEAGDYILRFYVSDGKGLKTGFENQINVKVTGGDCFAQPLGGLSVKMDSVWTAGYLTLNAELLKGKTVVAHGSEQVLLKNRGSMRNIMPDLSFDVIQWPAAQKAIEEAGGHPKANIAKTSPEHSNPSEFILAGDLTMSDKIKSEQDIDRLLARVKDGEIMIVRFDKNWAYAFHQKGILTEPVTEWGGVQTGHWLGNGWGYVDHFVGPLSIANSGTIGTNSWEVPADPKGFYPFKSNYPLSAYGLYMARPWLCRNIAVGSRMHELEPTLLVLLGTIDYGKGKIILNPCYRIDDDNAFSDMLFYNMITMAAQGKW